MNSPGPEHHRHEHPSRRLSAHDAAASTASRRGGKNASGGSTPLRLLAPFALGGLAVALTMATVATLRTPAERESDIIRHIHETAMAEPFGWFGPWRITAESIDPATGEMIGFGLNTETLSLTAARSRVQIDAEADTVSLELWDVVLIAVPDEEGGTVDGVMQELDHYVLGPIDYGRRIRPDVRGPAGGSDGPADLPIPAEDIARGTP